MQQYKDLICMTNIFSVTLADSTSVDPHEALVVEIVN